MKHGSSNVCHLQLPFWEIKSSSAVSIIPALQPLDLDGDRGAESLHTGKGSFQVGLSRGSQFGCQASGFPENFPASKASSRTIKCLYEPASVKDGRWGVIPQSLRRQAPGVLLFLSDMQSGAVRLCLYALCVLQSFPRREFGCNGPG